MKWVRPGTTLVACMSLIALAGCHSIHQGQAEMDPVQAFIPKQSHLSKTVPLPPQELPRELDKTTLPEYIIEPPDILLIDALRVVPLPPYRVEAFDVLAIQVAGALPDRPIEGAYVVEPGGTINLGLPYGVVHVEGLAIPDVTEAIRRQLSATLRDPEVLVSLSQTAASQQIAGEHLVGMDGHVTLGSYGKVYVTGMTQDQARAAIESHLSRFLDQPRVAVDIFAYNSKVYYVITQGAGLGDGVVRFPITGNETVLDAVSQINGLESASSKRIWVARPAPYGSGCDQILPVDWQAVTQRADTATNFQLMPGDRLYVAEDRFVAFDVKLSKLLSPVERIFGFTALGTNTVSGIRFFTERGQRGGFGGF